MTTRILLYCYCSLLVVLGLDVPAYIEQANSVYAINYNPETGMPASLSGNEFIIVRDTTLADPRVQQLIAGRNYIISDCCGFVQNGSSAQWLPVINLSVPGQLQIAATVDLESRKVISVQSGPYLQHYAQNEDVTKAEQVAKQSSTSTEEGGGGGSGTPILAVNNSTVLPLVAGIAIVIGGATVGVFYYLRRRDRLATQGPNST